MCVLFCEELPTSVSLEIQRITMRLSCFLVLFTNFEPRNLIPGRIVETVGTCI